MALEQALTSFGQKLDWLKNTCRVTDGEIGAAVSVSDSLVCRWRKDERSLERSDGRSLESLAAFFLRQAALAGQVPSLALALGMAERDVIENGSSFQLAFNGFLYDEKPIRTATAAGTAAEAAPIPATVQAAHLGIDGLLDALAQLGQRLQATGAGTDAGAGADVDANAAASATATSAATTAPATTTAPPAPATTAPAATTAPQISVYLSLEHSRILRDAAAGRLWDRLWQLGGGAPVRLVFDKWDDPDEATKTLRGLLPYMQSGRLRLNLIKSTQKVFYSNICFFAKEAGIVITTEPVGSLGDSVSMLVQSPDYVNGMAAVFARFDKNTKAVEKHLGPSSTKEEAACFEQLFAPGADLKAAIDGVSLLYLGVDAYTSLLRQNGVPGTQRAYRIQRFAEDRQRFEAFLESNRVTELLSLAAIDRMLATGTIETPDLSFCSRTIKADSHILKDLLAGMLRCLEQQRGLTIHLSRRGLPQSGFCYRLKGDSFVLLQAYGSSGQHAVYSNTWLLVYEYLRQFEQALQDDELISARDSVRTAIQIRLESLGGR